MYRVARTLPRRAPTLLSQRNVSFSLPTISTLETVKSTQQDFKGLFSSETVNELWFKRGQQLVEGLNQSLEQASASSSESQSNNLLDIIAQTIQKPEHYGIYSYGSLLYNLQFFLESLKENSAEVKLSQSEPKDLLKTGNTTFGNIPADENLKSWLIDSFGSIEEFRNLLLNSAKAIKGDGLVWLVAESNLSQNILKQSPSITEPGTTKDPVYNNLAIVNTYNAGVVDDSLRSGQVNRLKLQKEANLQLEIDRLTLGTAEEAEFNTLYNDKKLLPVLAIDGSMRNYLLDYGVYGKQQYLENVWECIDWDVVSKRLPVRTKQFINSY
ncbi:Mn-superoxide dismutase [Suhomyces tanzawaensis NRRL Y-17324]|uniref:Mn-superoxide dismutase n=1 Tax=Suhomyces tanzawaensis NRRL Y-17324 TaxID=984487 RepID=A0A1E4SGB6_9ASCO|nr:Mn-superoxide dismutase [Suhomyces tanzawaensis NRRL Y-17324]ODV78510.1 Mn-superoxide dismutase [Suhomyces tanzawaensis NRRL Y-17324]